MDIIRRNTDYAIRAMIYLAVRGRVTSTRQLARARHMPYPLAAKLMQKLQKNGMVKSTPGPLGGFQLKARPSEVALLDIIVAIQGPLVVSKCVFDPGACSLAARCSINPRLGVLQKSIDRTLKEITLADLAGVRSVTGDQ